MFRRAFYSWSHFLLFLALVKFTRAGYLVDDADSSILYAPMGAGGWEHISGDIPVNLTGANGSVFIIDYSRAYYQTITFSFCNSECTIGIPFTGSGITIYGFQVDGVINFTASLDGNPSPSPSPLPMLPAGSPTMYNITLYDTQSLSLSNHKLTITSTHDFFFDYANVNQTDPASNPLPSSLTVESSFPSSSAPVMTSLPPIPQPARFPVAAVVGGMVGGLVAVAAIVCAFLYFRRRPPTPAEFGTQPNVTTSNPPDVSPGSPLYPSRGSNNIAQTANRSPSADFLTPTRALDSDSPVDWRIPNQLTDDQATYVQNMYSLNVPAPAIALVVERMLQEGGAAGESSTGGFGVRRGNTIATMPPSYADS